MADDENLEAEADTAEPAEDGSADAVAVPDTAAEDAAAGEVIASDGGDVEDFDDIDFPDDADFDALDEADGGGIDRKRMMIIGGSAGGGIIVLALAAIFLFGGGEESGPPSEKKVASARSSSGAPVVSMKLAPRAKAKAKSKAPTNAKTTPPARRGVLTPPTKSVVAGGATPAAKPAASGSVSQTSSARRAAAVRNQSGAGIVAAAVSATAFGEFERPPRAKPLTPAPDRTLVETGPEGGKLPKVAADGRQPWQAYQRVDRSPAGQPRIAVVVYGLGMSRTATLAAIQRLPVGVTLSFNSYAPDLGQWLASARADGHEVLISVPMEPANFPIADPGPLALQTDLDAAENIKRLNRILSLGYGYVGIVNALGSQFAGSEAAFKPILESLKKRGLMYLDNGLVKTSRGPALASAIGLPWASGNIKIDNVASTATIARNLGALEAMARKNSKAIAMAEPYPVTISQLTDWISTLAQKQIALVPVSAMAQTAKN